MFEGSPDRSAHEGTPSARDLNRRTVLRTAAWALPAVTAASAVPAFAATPLEPVCSTVTATFATWSTTSGAIANSGNTGWLKRGTYGGQFISANEAQWFNGTGTQGPGRTNEPDGSFISFANNNSQSAPAVVTVSYNFTMDGPGVVDVAGTLKFGYGNSGSNPQWTERQLVDVELVDNGIVHPLARLGHQRKGTAANADAAVYLPANANATTYGAMASSDASLRASGYVLHLASGSGGHSTVASYGPSAPVTLGGTAGTSRTITINYKLTLPRRHTAAGVSTVNDDVILNPPTVNVYCTP
ncbi:MAG: hypothetical protein ACI379_03830 [Nocardioides sp.]|uniref:hypothetical protein n=1 Tax=Nocardioides sp. TaxID=35761 RepID=UPI003F0B0D72